MLIPIWVITFLYKTVFVPKVIEYYVIHNIQYMYISQTEKFERKMNY